MDKNTKVSVEIDIALTLKSGQGDWKWYQQVKLSK